MADESKKPDAKPATPPQSRPVAQPTPPQQPIVVGNTMLIPGDHANQQAIAMAEVQRQAEMRDIDEGPEGGRYYVGGRMENGKRVGGRWVNADGETIEDESDQEE